jgi:hypothetical protein
MMPTSKTIRYAVVVQTGWERAKLGLLAGGRTQSVLLAVGAVADGGERGGAVTTALLSLPRRCPSIDGVCLSSHRKEKARDI